MALSAPKDWLNILTPSLYNDWYIGKVVSTHVSVPSSHVTPAEIAFILTLGAIPIVLPPAISATRLPCALVFPGNEGSVLIRGLFKLSLNSAFAVSKPVSIIPIVTPVPLIPLLLTVLALCGSLLLKGT